MDEKTTFPDHLTDAELFSLAAPAAGEPEALPRHLSQCQSCSRALQEWKASIRALAEEDVDALASRSTQQWSAAEEATMVAIRRAGRPGRGRHPLRWVVGIAASLVVIALALPARRSVPTAAILPTPAAEPALSASDRDDDALLRDVAYLARGGDTLSDPESDENL